MNEQKTKVATSACLMIHGADEMKVCNRLIMWISFLHENSDYTYYRPKRLRHRFDSQDLAGMDAYFLS